MAIVSSEIAVQIDLGGQWFVVEHHTDNVAIVHSWRYTPAKSVDLNAKMAEHAITLNEQLMDEEVRKALEVDAAPVIQYQTGTQFLQRLRELYRDSRKEICAHIARWIINRLDAGQVTAAQMRNVFDLTAQQWTALETKLRALKASIESVDGAVGE